MFLNKEQQERYTRWIIRFIAIELWIFTAKAILGVIFLLIQSLHVKSLLFFGVPLMRPYAWNYETMIASIYIVWATYLWRAAKNPQQHASLINFTIWANLLHGLIMVIQSVINAHEFYRLLFDSFTLFIPPMILLLLRSKTIVYSKDKNSRLF